MTTINSATLAAAAATKNAPIILTHAGGAHRDELLAIALLSAGHFKCPCTVLRGTGLEADAVVDVDMIHDPIQLKFDHHQERGMPAAFRLVAQFLRLDDELSAINKWWTVTSDLDTNGPFQVAKSIGIETDVLFSLLSPIEGMIIREFGEGKEFDSSHWIPQFLFRLGNSLIEAVSLRRERFELLDKGCTVFSIGGLEILTHTIKDKPSLYMEDWAKSKGITPSVSVIPDDRSNGWTLYRHNDHPLVNFSSLDGKDGIEFAHKGGFIAKTKECSQADAINFVFSACDTVAHCFQCLREYKPVAFMSYDYVIVSDTCSETCYHNNIKDIYRCQYCGGSGVIGQDTCPDCGGLGIY